MNTLTVKWISIETLIPYINNAKQHPPEQIDQIAASIQAFGFNDPIGIDTENVIIEGHGRLLAAQKLGLEKIPVIQLGHLSEAERKAYALAHNKLTLNTGWDLELLRTEFESLKELDFKDLQLTGFREIELSNLSSVPSLPESEPELDESILEKEDPNNFKQVTCPNCQESFYVE